MYEEYVEQMKSAQNAKQRRMIVTEMCRLFGFGVQKAYTVLFQNGWDSGRKKRADAEQSSVTAEQLKAVASVVRYSLRKNGKTTMSVNVARSILQQNGIDIGVKDSRLRELLKNEGLTVKEAKVPSPHQRMRTLYPNQVHEADPSVALLYYAPNGKQKVVGDDEEYKNKSFLAERMKCWRYVLTDHYSGSICVRYYAVKGENSATMYDFLLYAWGKKNDPVYGFHGLPEILVWDCGSANVSRPVTKALTALRVKTMPHLPGNPRAKGQVECTNNLVETQFESRLKLEPVGSVEELNEAAERWCAAYNANLLEGLDTRLTRAGRKIGSRQDLWNRIAEDQLRELPDADICRLIFTTGVQVRKVGGDLAITIVHPKTKMPMRYSLSHLPGIMVGMDVNAQPVLVDEKPLVLVSYEDDGVVASYEVEPIVYDDAGFDITSPVFGQNYKREPDTKRESTAAELAELASGGMEKKDDVPFKSISSGLGLSAHSYIKPENPFAQHTTGRQIDVASNVVEVHEILITATETAKRFKARTGYIPDGFISRMKKEYPAGVPSGMIDDLVHEYEDGGKAEIKLA